MTKANETTPQNYYREELEYRGQQVASTRAAYLAALKGLSYIAVKADQEQALSRLEIARRAGVSITTARRWFSRA